MIIHMNSAWLNCTISSTFVTRHLHCLYKINKGLSCGYSLFGGSEFRTWGAQCQVWSKGSIDYLTNSTTWQGKLSVQITTSRNIAPAIPRILPVAAPKHAVSLISPLVSSVSNPFIIVIDNLAWHLTCIMCSKTDQLCVIRLLDNYVRWCTYECRETW